MNYELIDISGDVGIKAYGKDCADAWGNAGIGMYSLITDLEKIEEKKNARYSDFRRFPGRVAGEVSERTDISFRYL